MKKGFTSLVLGILALTTMHARGCDAEKVAFEVFKQQGLVVLRPARDYVRVGGLVSVKQNVATYRDPADPPPSDPNVATKFRSVLMAQTSNQSTQIGTALSALGSLIPVPIGLNVDNSRQVSLGQIDSSGIRLITDALDAQIQKPKTAAKARELLDTGSEVFIVQEVYLAKSMDLTATTKDALGVSLGSGAALPECSISKEKQNEQTEQPKKQTSSAESAKPALAATDGAPGATPVRPKADETTQVAGTSTPPEVGHKPDGLSVAVSLCRAGDVTIKFQAAEPIAFAVRLAPIERLNNQLRIRDGGFRFPKSLGTSRLEKATAETPNRPELSLRLAATE